MRKFFPKRSCRSFAVSVSLCLPAALPTSAQPLTPAVPAAQPAACDQGLASAFAGDPLTKIILVRAFKKGDDLSLTSEKTGKLATDDLCLVKMVVGPGNPGPKDAPSTSPGIGMEIWLPSHTRWNGRIHVLGGGGYVGMSDITSTTQISNGIIQSPVDVAEGEGAVTGMSDAGHVSPGTSYAAMGDGSFALKPDGTINTTLWKDLAERSTHELALKTKALTKAYYGRDASYSYFDGCSQGGRQGYMEAQAYPDDFNGILVGAPALYWSRLGIGTLYAQLVMERDLGKPLSPDQLNLVSAAAISACDTDLNGEHAGYISEPEKCRYNPIQDKQILCASDGGGNDTPACVTRKEAAVIVKIWYGATADGSAPDPAVSIGYSSKLDRGQMWFGFNRGTQLAGRFGMADSVNGKARAFPIGALQVAMAFGDPKIATPEFRNASGNGADGWKALSYADLARADGLREHLRARIGGIETDSPDLSGFRNTKGKMIYYHGMADQILPIASGLRYDDQMVKRMGGRAAVNRFYRFYPIPGMGHCAGLGSVNGLPGVSPPAQPPLPAPSQLYTALVAWVEKGRAPETIMISNRSGTVKRPLCSFPKKLKYLGGDRALAESYKCE